MGSTEILPSGSNRSPLYMQRKTLLMVMGLLNVM